jgi:hypothetical protein
MTPCVFRLREPHRDSELLMVLPVQGIRRRGFQLPRPIGAEALTLPVVKFRPKAVKPKTFPTPNHLGANRLYALVERRVQPSVHRDRDVSST